jgi:hypothetical protein
MGVLTARSGRSLIAMTEPAAAHEPNQALRAVRQSLLMSQGEFALAIRAAGQRAGEPNDCAKRLVQRWEAGYVTGTPRGNYARALEAVTGQPIENLGFRADADRGGVNRRQALGMAGAAAAIGWAVADDKTARGPLTGIWRSRYEFVSSSRGGETFASSHYVVLIQHGDRLQVRSLPETAQGRVMMDLTVSGSVVTGTWQEITDAAGYYSGSTYHGAIQFTAGPAGTRLTGTWVGFNKDGGIQTGPWTMDLVSSDTGKSAQTRYNRPVEDADA